MPLRSATTAHRAPDDGGAAARRRCRCASRSPSTSAVVVRRGRGCRTRRGERTSARPDARRVAARGTGGLSAGERRPRSRAPRARPRPRRLQSPRSPCLRAPKPTSRHATAAPGARSAITTGTAAAHASGLLPSTTRLPPGSIARAARSARCTCAPVGFVSRPDSTSAPSAAGAMEVRWSVAVSGRISRPSRSAGASSRRRGSAPYTSRPARDSTPTSSPAPHSVCSTRPFTPFRCSATTSAVGAGTGVGSSASSAFATARLAPGVACSTIETRRSSIRSARTVALPNELTWFARYCMYQNGELADALLDLARRELAGGGHVDVDRHGLVGLAQHSGERVASDRARQA